MINKYPALIVRCTGAADVVEAVHFANAHDLPAAIRDIIGQWTDPADTEQHIPWVRERWKALDAHAMGGVYVNHLGADEPERVRDAYGHNYARLVQIKQHYDPRNVFRFNQNIRPMV